MKAIFQPWVTMQRLFGDTHEATVTKENDDGTVNLIAHDGHDTPHENVPLIPPEGDRPAAGFFATAVPEPKSAEEKQVLRDEAEATEREEARQTEGDDGHA